MKSKRVGVAIAGLFLATVLVFMQDSSGGLTPEDPKSAAGVSDTAAASGTAVDDLIKNQFENHSLRWFYRDPQTALAGVALVIHGLNLRPDRMQPIISKLTESGIDVLGLSLRGHGENYSHDQVIDEERARLEAFKNVSYQLWLNEAYLAYSQLKERGAQKGVPLFLTAFSLGGLIGLDLLAANDDVRFDKLVLFAPAIILRPTIYLGRLLSPFGRLVIPSMAPKAYLANKKGTPMAAYNALFEGLNRFNQHAAQKLNIPTLIFIDEQDEFIPLNQLKKLVAEKKWDQWRIYRVEKDQSARDERFYHHIIDASSTGEAVWQEMMNAVVNHLLN
jgi:esterase/lipase